jgi:hypothetical protein
LAIRTRKQIYIDYNPSAPFWTHDKLIGTSAESNDLSASVKLIISDHRHNNFLTDEDHYKIENIKDKELWRVYARGLTGNLEGIIFSDWKEIPDDQFPDTDFWGGLDFGYTNDPTAGVKVAKVGNNIFIHELCYEAGIAPIQLKQIFELNGFDENTTIYTEHDPDMVTQLRSLGLYCLPANKGKGSINAGISKLKEYNVYYTASSKNLAEERKRYMWIKDKITGKPTNTPIDSYNHCFVGDTDIITINGNVKIKDIKVGELVLTSKGYRKVLLKHNNGLQQISNYLLQFDTFSVNLCSTYNHKVKTEKEWTSISELKQGNQLFYSKNLMAKNTIYTIMRSILAKELKECTELYVNFTMVKLKEVIMFTIKMAILTIMILPTLILLEGLYICVLQAKKGLKTTQNLLKNFMQKALRQQKSGINQKKVENGTKNTVKNHGLINRMQNLIANNVAKSLKVDINTLSNSAITIAKLKHLEQGESYYEQVYDLTVEGEHEYFANGILVHNCLDAIRYAVYTHFYYS